MLFGYALLKETEFIFFFN